jgi:transcription antitermination factor NusG
MASLTINAISSTPHGLVLPSSYCELLWYAAYTSANHEKRVAEQLAQKSVEHFLPLYQTLRRWKDRRVNIQLPLFPGYVFVRLVLHDRLQVLRTPGVAQLVGFNGTPAALPEEEIEALKKGFVCGVRAEPHPFMTAGRRVRVKDGPLAGMTGILVKRKSRTRLVVCVELIRRAMAVEIEETDLELVAQ